MRMLPIALLSLMCCQVSALRCWECNNARSNEECLRKGKLKNCVEKEAICEDQVRHEGSIKAILIEKRCKQAQACVTNVNQNLRKAYPTQCHVNSPTSTCRCCCSTNGCNKKLLACWKAYRTYDMRYGQGTCANFPKVPQGANMQCQGNNEPGTRCRFTCHQGCYLVGKPQLTCMNDLSWDFPPPRCPIKTCPALRVPKNGYVKCTNKNRLRSKCTYGCLPNHRLMGRRFTECFDYRISRSRGIWSYRRTPNCFPMYCPKQGPIYHGSMRCTRWRRPGSYCSFRCREGYTVFPSQFTSNLCTYRGTWNKPYPCCTAVCPPLVVADLIIVLDSSSSVGKENWKKMVKFVELFLSNFTVGDDAARYGIFRYNREVDLNTQILLSDYPNDKEGFFKALHNIPYNGSGTRTANALQHVADVMLKVGNRPLAPDIVLLVTDGKSQDNVTAPSKAIRDMNATLLVLPIAPPSGKAFVEAELHEIVGHNNEANILRDALKGGFDALDDKFARKLARVFCPPPCVNPFHKHSKQTPARLMPYISKGNGLSHHR